MRRTARGRSRVVGVRAHQTADDDEGVRHAGGRHADTLEARLFRMVLGGRCAHREVGLTAFASLHGALEACLRRVDQSIERHEEEGELFSCASANSFTSASGPSAVTRLTPRCLSSKSSKSLEDASSGVRKSMARSLVMGAPQPMTCAFSPSAFCQRPECCPTRQALITKRRTVPARDTSGAICSGAISPPSYV